MNARRVLVAVPDLFFSTRIQATAKELGIACVACAPAALADRFRLEPAPLVIVDLHAVGALDAIRALREVPAARDTRVVGFYSHVDNELRASAIAAGVSDAMPRSAFTAKLAGILSGTAA
jgi:DNA-binding NarL/FixJ family response regulator